MGFRFLKSEYRRDGTVFSSPFGGLDFPVVSTFLSSGLTVGVLKWICEPVSAAIGFSGGKRPRRQHCSFYDTAQDLQIVPGHGRDTGICVFLAFSQSRSNGHKRVKASYS